LEAPETKSKKGADSTYCLGVLANLATIREPTPGSWAFLLIISLQKKSASFQRRDSKRMLL